MTRTRIWIVAAVLLAAAAAVLVVTVGPRVLAVVLPTAPTLHERLAISARDFEEQERSKGMREPYFAEYSLSLDRLNVPLTRPEVLAKFGPPDLKAGPAGQTEYVYFYDRFGAKDWYVVVFLNGGNVTGFGYNATSELDRSHQWQSFDAP